MESTDAVRCGTHIQPECEHGLFLALSLGRFGVQERCGSAISRLRLTCACPPLPCGWYAQILCVPGGVEQTKRIHMCTLKFVSPPFFCGKFVSIKLPTLDLILGSFPNSPAFMKL